MKKKKTLLLLLLFISLLGMVFPAPLKNIFSTITVYADTTLPAPKLLSAKANSSSSITVKWEAVDGADGYRVYQKTAGTKWQKIKTITNPQTLSYKKKSLSMGVKYTYTVRAYKLVDGKRVYGSYDKKGISARPTIPAPELISAKAINTSSITIKWNPVNGTDGYRVYRKEPGGKWTNIKTLVGNNITSYTDSKLRTGREYCYTVRAYKTINSTNVFGKYISAGINATTKMTTPKLLSLKASGSTKAILTWKETPDVDGYQIYRKTANSKWTRVKTLAGAENTSYTHNSLVNGITYIYTVRAYNLIDGKYIRSGYDKTGLKVTTKTPKITGITAKPLSTTSIQIQWPESKNVDGYRVYRKTINDTSWTRMTTITNPATTTYTDKKAEMGRTYYYTVRAYKKVDGSNLWGYYDATGIKAATAIPVPELESAKALSHNSILVTWKKVEGADGYRIYRKTDAETDWTRLKIRAGADKVTYTNTGLNPHTTYYYTIIAYKKHDGKNVLSKYNKYGIAATTKESPYDFEDNEIILIKGESRDLILSEGTAVSWKSSDPATVSVSNGSVTAHKAGKAIITAIVNGEEHTCNITVEDPALPETFTITAGETNLLSLEGTSQKVEWSMREQYEGSLELLPSGNNSVSIKAIKPGNAYVTAKIADHQQTFTCMVIIKGYMKADRSTVTVHTGERVNINITTNCYTNDIYASSSDSSIASIYRSDYSNADYAATIYGNKPGTTIVRIASSSSEPSTYIDIAVTVIEKAASSTGAATLINYLDRNGTLENGIRQFKLRRYIDWEDIPYWNTLSVGYEETTDKFYFSDILQSDNAIEEISMNMRTNQTADIIGRYQYTADGISFLAETTLNASNYTGELLSFRLLKADGISEEKAAEMLKQASNSFDSAFNSWARKLLSPYTGTRMYDLGFILHDSWVN